MREWYGRSAGAKRSDAQVLMCSYRAVCRKDHGCGHRSREDEVLPAKPQEEEGAHKGSGLPRPRKSSKRRPAPVSQRLPVVGLFSSPYTRAPEVERPEARRGLLRGRLNAREAPVVAGHLRRGTVLASQARDRRKKHITNCGHMSAAPRPPAIACHARASCSSLLKYFTVSKLRRLSTAREEPFASIRFMSWRKAILRADRGGTDRGDGHEGGG